MKYSPSATATERLRVCYDIEALRENSADGPILPKGKVMTPLDRFYHLLMMAAADKRMNEAELAFLSERAFELGISQEDFHDTLQKAVQGDGELVIPTGKADRRALLKDLIRMMAADGVMDDREKALFAHVAAAMEIDTDDLHRVIDATLAERE